MNKKFSFFLFLLLFVVLSVAMAKHQAIMAAAGPENETNTTYYDSPSLSSPVGNRIVKCDGSIIMAGQVTPYSGTIIVQRCTKADQDHQSTPE